MFSRDILIGGWGLFTFTSISSNELTSLSMTNKAFIRTHQMRIVKETGVDSVLSNTFTLIPHEESIIIMFEEQTLLNRLSQTTGLQCISLSKLATLVQNNQPVDHLFQSGYILLRVMNIPDLTLNGPHSQQSTGYLDMNLEPYQPEHHSEPHLRHEVTLRFWFDQRNLSKLIQKVTALSNSPTRSYELPLNSVFTCMSVKHNLGRPFMSSTSLLRPNLDPRLTHLIPMRTEYINLLGGVFSYMCWFNENRKHNYTFASWAQTVD